MDFGKEDLRLIEHALSRDAWGGQPVKDLLLRVRVELLNVHGIMSDVPSPNPDALPTPPDPRRTKPWPALKSSQDATGPAV